MKGRVLVVDDDTAILEVLEMRLAAMGLEVTRARNARDALAAIQSRSYDLGLFDLRMEPTDGITLMQDVHASLKKG